MKHGKLTVKKEMPNGLCIATCDCGNTVSVRTSGLHEKSCCSTCAKQGNKVYGVGVNDFAGKTRIKGKKDAIYKAWEGMLMRCYSEKYQRQHKAYIDCTVDPRWHSYVGFRQWIKDQDYEDKQVDKDIKMEGNKVYGPETCLMVSHEVNNLFIQPKKKDGLPVGVIKRGVRYEASCRAWGGEKQHLGTFDTVAEAEAAYKKSKAASIEDAASEQTDQKLIEALLRRAEALKK